jgi:hypothetical protein
VEVRHAADGTRWHLYVRQPEGVELPKVSLRFEGGSIEAADVRSGGSRRAVLASWSQRHSGSDAAWASLIPTWLPSL